MKRLAVAFATSLLLAACGGNDAEDVNARTLIGTALSVLDGSPQPNRAFTVIDLAQPSGSPAATVANGTSSSTGQFSFDVKSGLHIIVVFPPSGNQPRTSGLFSVDETGNGKALQNFTDIACQAGATAVGAGAITAAQLDQARINNLEAGAQTVLSEHNAANAPVDFTDAQSVSDAANEVRTRTDDGAHGPT